MKLGLKIILPILLLLVVVTGSFGYILYNLKQQETVLSTEGTMIRTLNGLNERLGREQDITVYYVLAYRFNPDRASLNAISQAELDKSKTLDEMFPFITTPRGRELINSYIDSRKEVEPLRNGLIQAIDEGNQETISLNYNKWNIQTQNVKAALADIGAYNINSLERTLVTVGDIRNKISDVIIILVFVIIATILSLFFYLRMVITTPIINLAKFAKEVANKNFTTTTTTTTRKDELGMLSRAFNTMVAKLKESYSTLEQKVAERTVSLMEKTREAEYSQKATLNVLDDLNSERIKLQIAKAKDEAMLASIGDGVIIVDLAGKITFMNQVAENLLNFKNTEVLDKLFFDVVSIEGEKGEQIYSNARPMAITLATGAITSGIYNYARKDKTKFPVAITVAPVRLENQIIGAIMVFRDITKEKEIEKAKTEFVSLASHQLRTPLSAVRWYTEMLLTGMAGKVSAQQKKYLEEVHSGDLRMVALVNALLNVSRLELGTFAVEPVPTDVAALVAGVIAEQKPIIETKKLRITTAFGTNLPTMQADPKLLHMVFENLLSNAVKYTPEGGGVTLTLSLDIKKNILFKISDSGYGIPANQHDRIFTKFFRADNVQTLGTEGTGLGLYIVKSIVEQAGGAIWFESLENKSARNAEPSDARPHDSRQSVSGVADGGTTFYVTLPIVGIKKVGTKSLS